RASRRLSDSARLDELKKVRRGPNASRDRGLPQGWTAACRERARTVAHLDRGRPVSLNSSTPAPPKTYENFETTLWALRQALEAEKLEEFVGGPGHPMRRKIVPAQEDRTAERLLPVIARKSNVNGPPQWRISLACAARGSDLSQLRRLARQSGRGLTPIC